MMNLTALATVLGMVVGWFAGIPAIVGNWIPRVEPGSQGVKLRLGVLVLDPKTSVPDDQRDGIDNALLIEKTMRPVLFPFVAVKQAVTTPQTFDLPTVEFFRMENETRIVYHLAVKLTWHIKESEPRGVNYMARALFKVKDGLPAIIATDAVRALSETCWDSAVPLTALSDADRLVREMRDREGDTMLRYGVVVDRVTVVSFAPIPISTYGSVLQQIERERVTPVTDKIDGVAVPLADELQVGISTYQLR